MFRAYTKNKGKMDSVLCAEDCLRIFNVNMYLAKHASVLRWDRNTGLCFQAYPLAQRNVVSGDANVLYFHP